MNNKEKNMTETIRVISDNVNNLKNVSLEIPKKRLPSLLVFQDQENQVLYLTRSPMSHSVS
jgi:hypothetical protein